MLVHSSVSLSAYDGQRWVINPAAGPHLLVNAGGARLFTILQQATCLDQALRDFNQAFATSLTAAEFWQLVTSRFASYGILRAEASVGSGATHGTDYIKLRIPLLTAAGAGRLAAPFHILFAPRVFWGLLLGQSVLLAAVLGPAQLVPPQNAQEAFGVGAAVYGSLLLHEAGHIAACARLGLRHGGIGFGFYAYVFPVLFADITGIWQATKQQRVIGNLAGIFMQLLLATGLTTAYLLQPYAPLLLASTGIALTAIWQLNPFVRRDGYWLLSDLTNTPNLSEQATQARQELLRGQRWTARRLVVGIYGLLNDLAFGALLLYLLFLHCPAMLELPAALPALLGELPARWPHLTHSQLVALGCYLVWLRVGVATLVQRKRKP